MLRCPGCSSQSWDLRADGVDDLPRLEGTLCCCTCGLAFDARGGVLDMVPGIVEDRVSALRQRLESPPVANFYEERLRHLFTPLASPLRAPERAAWLRDHAPAAGARAVVDFGCGRGADLEVMREAASPRLALGIDLSHVLLAEAARTAREQERPNVAFLRANLEELPLVGPRFAWASCYGVLHRLRRPGPALAALASLLEPGARFTCLTTVRLPPGALALGQHALGAVGRVHVFGRDDLEVMVRGAGLELEELRSYGPVALLAGRRAQG